MLSSLHACLTVQSLWLFQKQMVFIESFLQNNRLEHLHQVMGYHPQYLEAFVKTQNYLLREDGPLPFPYRHYIAIMVSFFQLVRRPLLPVGCTHFAFLCISFSHF